MLYLESRGLCFTSPSLSKVLFASDGTVQLAFFESSSDAGFATARILGIITLAMMQKGITSEDTGSSGELTLNTPSMWSPEAQNFLDISSHAALSAVTKVCLTQLL